MSDKTKFAYKHNNAKEWEAAKVKLRAKARNNDNADCIKLFKHAVTSSTAALSTIVADAEDCDEANAVLWSILIEMTDNEQLVTDRRVSAAREAVMNVGECTKSLGRTRRDERRITTKRNRHKHNKTGPSIMHAGVLPPRGHIRMMTRCMGDYGKSQGSIPPTVAELNKRSKAAHLTT